MTAVLHPAAASTAAGHQPTWRVETINGAEVLCSTDDTGIRWVPGERLHDVFDATWRGLGRRGRRSTAVEHDGLVASFDDLRDRSLRLARHLAAAHGVGPGSRVALLLERSLDAPATVLALSRLGAAYLPLDASFPSERIGFMLDDTAVTHVVTTSDLAHHLAATGRPLVLLDTEHDPISRQPAAEPDVADTETDPLAYVIYTSGSTGQPKGVPIRQSSFCNFVRIAAERYGYEPGDRVYQGLTMAFDFSVEELWVPLVAGATIVPAPTGTTLVGDDLTRFLRDHAITALVCVPTLLATVEPELPELRLLLVSGEACPDDLIAPWFAPHRRILNAYGPTETTVTATWSVLHPDRPVTIGGPLPTYRIVILDPERPAALPAGAVGEIAIGGIALSDGYLHRPDQTARAFVDDIVGLPDNPNGRLYRTGDLGMIDPDGQVVYLGRIDTQVKIRGYRIELGEIESLARTDPSVGNAVVDVHRAEGADPVLVAYLTPADPATAVDIAAVADALRQALPSYMVPAHYELLDELPLLASTKVDRKALPAPVSPRWVGGDGPPMVAPRNETEARLASLLADVLGLPTVSVEAHFFDHLGADSLLLAGYVTAIRRAQLAKRVSLKQLYQHPTVAALAAAIAPTTPPGVTTSPAAAGAPPGTTAPDPVSMTGAPTAAAPASPTPTAAATAATDADADLMSVRGDANLAATDAAPAPGSARPVPARTVLAPHRPTRAAQVLTGVAQVLVQALAVFAGAFATLVTYRWVEQATSLRGFGARAIAGGALLYLGGGTSLIAVKWLAVGRFTPEPIRIWSPDYLRFWVAKQAIQVNPFNLLVGTPLHTAYLRALGMRVGARSIVHSLPICVDLVAVGSDTVIRRDVVMTGYRAQDGWIRPGAVVIGDRALVAEGTVIDIGTSIGNDAQLGATSGLLEGQHVPRGARWQGSPAEPHDGPIDRVAPVAAGPGVRRRFVVLQVLGLVLVSLPAVFVPAVLLTRFSGAARASLPGSGVGGAALGALVAGGVLYVGALVAAAIVVLVVPRLLHRFVVDGVAHPLWGVQHQLARTIERTSNNRLLNTIFGDSSMILPWLAAVGYDLRNSTQTGSNFGVDQRHGNPFLVAFGRETLVSDGLRLMNLEVSATSFRVDRIEMPHDTYLGNVVHYPAGARVGENCLIATKAAVPVDGPLRTDVGILGSPAFEIPRSVARDRRFDHLKAPGIREERLRAKLRSNVVTMVLYLLRSWLLASVAVGSIGAALAITDGAATWISAAATAVATLATVVLGALLSIAAERAVCGFGPLEPRYCSLYDPRFWAHERFWKLNYNAFLRVFDGTPLKPVFLRLQGARVGRMVFDDGCGLTEPSLVAVGDNATLNLGSALQAHSLEDGTFKSDRITVGDGATLDTGAFVHYGTTVEAGAVVQADAFVMKGSTVTAGTCWHGNPAREVGPSTTATPARCADAREEQP